MATERSSVRMTMRILTVVVTLHLRYPVSRTEEERTTPYVCPISTSVMVMRTASMARMSKDVVSHYLAYLSK